MQTRPPAKAGGRNFNETEKLLRRYLAGQTNLVAGACLAGCAIGRPHPRQAKREQKVP